MTEVPEVLVGLISEDWDESDVPAVDDVDAGTASLALAAQALAANPRNRAAARTGLKEVLWAAGLLPDPEALGCNMLNEKFLVGNHRLKKHVKESRDKRRAEAQEA